MSKSDIEIAREAKMKPIQEILDGVGVPDEAEAYSPISRYIAKIKLEYLEKFKEKKDGKLILVTAITPTPAGEGKTTTSVGLSDGLNKIGKKSIVCLREPSLGPSFGMKGGAAGGGYAQVVPMEQINLHFTGDFHAITSAHNLLSALIDNHIYWGNNSKLLASNPINKVMGVNFKSTASDIWGIQYHPEITYDKMISLIHFRKERLLNNNAFVDEQEINNHVRMIAEENKVTNKDLRMRELENWLNYLLK